jgi:hypothetical protein
VHTKSPVAASFEELYRCVEDACLHKAGFGDLEIKVQGLEIRIKWFRALGCRVSVFGFRI